MSAKARSTTATSEWAVPPGDRVPYIKALAAIARADGEDEANDAEKEFIERVMKSWALDREQKADVRRFMKAMGDDVDLGAIVKPMKSVRSRHLLLHDVVNLGHADGHYSRRERAAVREIADAIGISRRRVAEVERWIKQGIAWREKGASLLEAE